MSGQAWWSLLGGTGLLLVVSAIGQAAYVRHNVDKAARIGVTHHRYKQADLRRNGESDVNVLQDDDYISFNRRVQVQVLPQREGKEPNEERIERHRLSEPVLESCARSHRWAATAIVAAND